MLLPIALLLSGSTIQPQFLVENVEDVGDATKSPVWWRKYIKMINLSTKSRFLWMRFENVVRLWCRKVCIWRCATGKYLYRGRYTNYSDILLTLNAPIPAQMIILKRDTIKESVKTRLSFMKEKSSPVLKRVSLKRTGRWGSDSFKSLELVSLIV